MVQRLCDKYGDDAENVIKRIMHVEFNNGHNRYKDLGVSTFNIAILQVLI